MVALWLWTARAASRGRNWVAYCPRRCLSLATLELIGNRGVAQVFFAVLTTGLEHHRPALAQVRWPAVPAAHRMGAAPQPGRQGESGERAAS